MAGECGVGAAAGSAQRLSVGAPVAWTGALTLTVLHPGLTAPVILLQDLALVCRNWHSAAQATPLCLELTDPQHLSPEARLWLARVPMEVRAAPHVML